MRWPMRWVAMLGMLALGALGWSSCHLGFYLNGECAEDTDLQTSYNYHEGAICVDGHAACPDGKPLCLYMMQIGALETLGIGCVGPCIECPADKPAICVYETETPGNRSFYCVEKLSDCWGGEQYSEPIPLPDACSGRHIDCL